MYFPFLSCEVNCSAVDLHIADRQNVHSMTLAVRGVLELYKAVKRELGLHYQILAFSISHNETQHKRNCSALDALPDTIDFGLSQAASFHRQSLLQSSRRLGCPYAKSRRPKFAHSRISWRIKKNRVKRLRYEVASQGENMAKAQGKRNPDRSLSGQR